jgi:P63C domain
MTDLPAGVSPGAALSRLGASKGGRARAERLTPEARSAAAREAAEARWGKSVMDATHEGELIIGDKRLECAVLEGPVRVISQGTVLAVLGRAPTMGRREITEGRPPFLSAANLRPFVSSELAQLYEPIQYRLPGTGARSVGYRAEILPMVCEVYLDARNEGVLLHNQHTAARAAETLIRGLARVGIIALVDEATGYQEVRARQELQRILEAYVQAEFRPWVRMFPDDFFREIYRLQGWAFRPGTSKRTPYVGKLIKHYIYEQLPNGVLKELEKINPANNKGRRPRKHHQHLTADTGNVHLDKQISTVTTLMRIARNQREFEDLFDRAFPPSQGRLPLIIEVPSAHEG